MEVSGGLKTNFKMAPKSECTWLTHFNFLLVLKFGKASVTLADITAGNGAVHAVDEVLFPEFGLLQSHANSELSMNLVQLLEDKGYVSFASALKQTRLDRVIDHEGHFTVFAPTDQAFDNPRAYPQDTTLVERVSYYIARGLIKESMADDELLVPSLLSKRKLRFNLYENGKVKEKSKVEIELKL